MAAPNMHDYTVGNKEIDKPRPPTSVELKYNGINGLYQNNFTPISSAYRPIFAGSNTYLSTVSSGMYPPLPSTLTSLYSQQQQPTPPALYPGPLWMYRPPTAPQHHLQPLYGAPAPTYSYNWYRAPGMPPSMPAVYGRMPYQLPVDNARHINDGRHQQPECSATPLAAKRRRKVPRISLSSGDNADGGVKGHAAVNNEVDLTSSSVDVCDTSDNKGNVDVVENNEDDVVVDVERDDNVINENFDNDKKNVDNQRVIGGRRLNVSTIEISDDDDKEDIGDNDSLAVIKERVVPVRKFRHRSNMLRNRQYTIKSIKIGSFHMCSPEKFMKNKLRLLFTVRQMIYDFHYEYHIVGENEPFKLLVTVTVPLDSITNININGREITFRVCESAKISTCFNKDEYPAALINDFWGFQTVDITHGQLSCLQHTITLLRPFGVLFKKFFTDYNVNFADRIFNFASTASCTVYVKPNPKPIVVDERVAGPSTRSAWLGTCLAESKLNKGKPKNDNRPSREQTLPRINFLKRESVKELYNE